MGSVPYSATAEELKAFCSTVAPVREFRLMLDPATNKSKGCGFCEFYDSASAARALQLCLLSTIFFLTFRFHDHGFLCVYWFTVAGRQYGNRILRVSSATGSHYTGNSTHGLQKATDRPPEATPSGPVIDKVIDCMNPNVLREVLDTVRDMDKENPEKARQLLMDNPQLQYALVKLLQKLDLIDETTANQLFIKDPSQLLPQLPQHPPQPQPQPQPQPPVMAQPVPIPQRPDPGDYMQQPAQPQMIPVLPPPPGPAPAAQPAAQQPSLVYGYVAGQPQPMMIPVQVPVQDPSLQGMVPPQIPPLPNGAYGYL